MKGITIPSAFSRTWSLLIVRRVDRSRWLEAGAMLFALAVGFLGISLRLGGLSNPAGNMDGITPLGFIALRAALGDIRMLLGKGLQYPLRIARYLWRTYFALWIATASFFLGQSDGFPEAPWIMPLLCTPVLLVLLLMFYWLVRVLFMQWRPSA